MVMLLVSFFSWWYGKGWEQVARSFVERQHAVSDAFSILQLLKTLFAPWRRIITYPGRSLPERFRAWGDNMFSRVVGFVVRLLVLGAAGITLVVVGVLTILEILIWPLLPPAIPILLIAGFLV
jgi:hypothetical protein